MREKEYNYTEKHSNKSNQTSWDSGLSHIPSFLIIQLLSCQLIVASQHSYFKINIHFYC